VKLQTIWKWESSKNLPLILGFVAAARLWPENLLAGLATLLVGIGLGVAVTRAVEPKLHQERYEMRWENTVVNFFLFVALSIPFIYYFHVENTWANWRTDLIAGICAGVLLTFGQSTVWHGRQSRLALQGLATTAAFQIIMLCLRLMIQAGHWGISLLSTVFVTLLASLVISLIDYREMYLA